MSFIRRPLFSSQLGSREHKLSLRNRTGIGRRGVYLSRMDLPKVGVRSRTLIAIFATKWPNLKLQNNLHHLCTRAHVADDFLVKKSLPSQSWSQCHKGQTKRGGDGAAWRGAVVAMRRRKEANATDFPTDNLRARATVCLESAEVWRRRARGNSGVSL